MEAVLKAVGHCQAKRPSLRTKEKGKVNWSCGHEIFSDCVRWSRGRAQVGLKTWFCFPQRLDFSVRTHRVSQARFACPGVPCPSICQHGWLLTHVLLPLHSTRSPCHSWECGPRWLRGLHHLSLREEISSRPFVLCSSAATDGWEGCRWTEDGLRHISESEQHVRCQSAVHRINKIRRRSRSRSVPSQMKRHHVDQKTCKISQADTSRIQLRRSKQ